MNFSTLFPIALSFTVWAAIFLLIKPDRIKDLLPVGALSAALFIITSHYLETTGLAFYTLGFLPILGGIPFFAIIWAAGAGILMVNFINKEPARNVFIVFAFTLLALVLDIMSVKLETHLHSTHYSFLHSFLFIFAGNATLVILAQGFFGSRVYLE